MFKTELHCHSQDASPCGHESAESLVEIYQKAGYDTVVLTNHFCRHAYNRYGMQNWQDYVDMLVRAVENLKRAADGRLHVLMGAEVQFGTYFNDYLWLGANEEFLRKTPTMFDLSLKEFHKICQENGWLLIQAHPFRKGMTIIPPEDVDGVEVYNGHTEHASRNFLAEAWANEYGLLKTSGTDLHDSFVPATGGILTEEEITDNEGLIRILKSGKYSLLKSDLVR